MLPASPPSFTPRVPALVFDLESLLLDIDSGIRLALQDVAQQCGKPVPAEVRGTGLRTRRLSEVLAQIAGDDDAQRLGQLADQYWRSYEERTRFLAARRAGADSLLMTLRHYPGELHYLSTLGPQPAARFLQVLDLQGHVSSVFSSPQPACPCTRARLLENFLKRARQPAAHFLLLSDSLGELAAAQRLGMPALALAYEPATRQQIDTRLAAPDLARNPGEVMRWLTAAALTRERLQAAAGRASSGST